MVRARDDGLAGEDVARPRGGDPADGAARDPERHDRREARRPDDDARRPTSRARRSWRRSRCCTRRTCCRSRCCSGSSRCSARSCRRTSRPSASSCRSSSGEDERTISQGSSLIEGGMAFSALFGPALAGLLIPLIGAPNVLYVDAATFLVSFLLVLTLVPKRKPLRAPAQRGLLAGLRFVVARRADRPAHRHRRGLRVRRHRAVGVARVLRVRPLRELADRRPVLRGARRRDARRHGLRRLRRAAGRAPQAGRVRDPRVRRAALGASADRQRVARDGRALHGDALHAARERPDHGRPHRAHARRRCGRR